MSARRPWRHRPRVSTGRTAACARQRSGRFRLQPTIYECTFLPVRSSSAAPKLFPIAPGLTILAAAFLLMWQVLEIVPRSIDFFVFSLDYAVAYVAGMGDRAMIEGEFQRFLAWERGWRTMRQAVWAAGLLLIGLAAWRGAGLGRAVGALLMLNGIRVAALLAASLAGAALPLGRGLFVVVNIACFGLLAAWLWLSPATEAQHSADCYRAIL